MRARRSRLAGIGAYLPERIVTNHELAERIDTSDEWIRARTGIAERRIAANGEFTSDLAVAAARRALDDAGKSVADIDMVIVATATPDLTFPSTATIVQQKLGMSHGAAFDVAAVCSGFLYGLKLADALMRADNLRGVLLIGAETFSRILDWEDRTTCVLFGDGAGAVVLEPSDDERGVLDTILRSNGAHRDLLYVDGGPSRTQTVGHLRMTGNQVFRFAVTDLSEIIGECAERAGVAVEAVDWFVPHQANQRIITAVAKKMGLDAEKIVSTVERHANTSAASVPLALCAAVEDGRIRQDDLVMLEAFGGGFTWGASLIRY